MWADQNKQASKQAKITLSQSLEASYTASYQVLGDNWEEND